MNIRIDEQYKVLKKSGLISLPSFTVLTGENGSGKSQLLRWINSICSGIREEFMHNSLEPMTMIPQVFSGLVSKNDGSSYSKVILSYPGISFDSPDLPQSSPNILESIIQSWSQLKSAAYACALVTDLNLENISEKIGIVNLTAQEFINASISPNQNYSPSYNYIHEHLIRQVLNLSSKSKKPLQDLTVIDAIAFYEIQNSQLSDPNLELLFHQFELKKKYYPTFVDGVKHPIEILNEILISTKFKYRAEYTFINGEQILSPIALTDITTGIRITPSELSSGEKTVMSIMKALYNSNTQGSFPDLILYDEPDAFLHPSLTQMMLDVIQKVIVEENNVDVIMTTHSPSTVALAPENCVYFMKREVGFPIEITHDEAISTLTYGLNGLYVSRESRRQIFVESENDECFYEKVYGALKPKLNRKVYLSFISSGSSKIDKNTNPNANCIQVKKITKELRTNGNNNIWGIVDWDLLTHDSVNDAFVRVLGYQKRYSIENYLLDPLLIAILMVYKKFVKTEDILLKNVKYRQFGELELEDVQAVINEIIRKIFPDEKFDNLKLCKLVNGFEVKIPQSFLLYQGHELETLIRNKIPQLKQIQNNKNPNNALKLEILKVVIDEYPEFLSADFIDLFVSLQS